jgi:hypothetical protein
MTGMLSQVMGAGVASVSVFKNLFRNGAGDGASPDRAAPAKDRSAE